MSGFGLDEIIAESERLSKSSRALSLDLVELNNERSTSLRDNADQILEFGSLEVDIAEKENLAKLNAHRQTVANARALGTDSSASTAVVSDINSRIREDLLRFNQASQQLEQMDSQDNLLSNPLGWFNSLMNRQEIASAASGAKERINTNAAALSNMYSLTKADALNNLALAETADAETIDKKSKQIALKAQIEANEARAKAATYDVEGLRILRDFGNDEFSRRVQGYNLQRQAYEFDISKRMQEKNLKMQEARLAAEARGNEAAEFIAGSVNAGATILGLSQIPQSVVESQYGKPTPIGQQLAILANTGFTSFQKGSAYIANSPIEAREVLAATGGKLPDSVSPEIHAAYEYADTEFAKISAAVAQLAPGSPATEDTAGLNAEALKDPNKVAKAYNAYFNSYLEQSDSKLGSTLQVKVSTLETKYPGIKNTVLYKTVLEPLGIADTEVSIKQLGELTSVSVLKGEIPAETASKELAAVSSTVFNDYRASSGRTLIGASLPGDEVFRFQVPVGNAPLNFPALGIIVPNRFSSKQEKLIINPASPTDWNAYFQRVLVEQRSKAVAESLRGAR